MKKRKQLNIAVFTLLIVTTFISCTVGRYVVYNFADVNDYKKFPERKMETNSTPFVFPIAKKGRFPKELNIKDNRIPFENYLEDNKTVAFLIIHNDSIQYEKYWGSYRDSSIVPSFSMAKSVTSILIGCALDDGFIKSIDEPITTYIPELSENGFDNVSIKHLLQMTSGIAFNESYSNPFGDAASFYYGLNLRKEMRKMKLKTQPGNVFEYASGNTQLLGWVLERSLKTQTITSYLQEKIWTPLGMEYDASWSIDRKKDGIEKTFCCLNARARDFAKIGRLYKNKGNWNGNQVVSQEWVEASTKLDTTDGSASFYQYQWWLPTPNEDFMAEGILGQFIYVHPAKDLIIVRLGKNEGKADWWTLFTSLSKAY